MGADDISEVKLWSCGRMQSRTELWQFLRDKLHEKNYVERVNE